MRTLIDEYLDGTLEAGERAELERQIAADPAVARLLAVMKGERALRAAAYASFQPSAEESRELAARMMNDIAGHQPAGYVGRWMKRALAVAAAIAIVAGSFAVGRMTASPAATQTPVVTTNPKAETQVVYRVLYFGENGEKEVREFVSLDEANDFVSKLETRRSEAQVLATADLSTSGSM